MLCVDAAAYTVTHSRLPHNTLHSLIVLEHWYCSNWLLEAVMVIFPTMSLSYCLYMYGIKQIVQHVRLLLNVQHVRLLQNVQHVRLLQNAQHLWLQLNVQHVRLHLNVHLLQHARTTQVQDRFLAYVVPTLGIFIIKLV